MHFVQVHASDLIARNAIWQVLNEGHDGRIRQSSLDFYRQSYVEKLPKGWTIVFLVAFRNANNPIGLSACAFGRKSLKVKHSITVVHPGERQAGIGKTLLRHKVSVLGDWFPDVDYKAYVSTENAPSISMCNSAGLHITGKGSRERDDKDPTHFYIFEGV